MDGGEDVHVNGWAGVVMRKPLGIQKCDGRTDTAGCRAAFPRLKTSIITNEVNDLDSNWQKLR